MFDRRALRPLLVPTLLALIAVHGCRRATPAPADATGVKPGAAATDSAQSPVIETETVTPQDVSGTIAATGKILVTEDRVASIGPVHDGKLVRLYAGQGMVVKKGQKLADLESADVDQAEADYLKALADYENARRSSAAEVKFAQATYDRTKMLYEKTITAGKNLEAAEHDLEIAKAAATSSVAGAEATLSAARRQLLVLGLSASDVDALAKHPTVASVFSLTSPISGTVVERNATLGASVGSDDSVFKIIDISRVWIDANVFEKDLGRVARGQQVMVSVPAFPGAVFEGRVILVSSVLDPETRSVTVRTEVPNPEGRLKPDMFADVRIVTDVHRSSVSVPQSAVLADGDTSVVFVANGSDYAKRVVSVGVADGDRVEITDGLHAGDKVVVKGNYLLLQGSSTDK